MILHDGSQVLEAPIGPMTRAKARRLKDALNGLIKEVQAEVEFKQVPRTYEKLKIINVIEVQSTPKDVIEGWSQGCQLLGRRPPALQLDWPALKTPKHAWEIGRP